MKARMWLLGCVALLLAVTSPLQAHHSFAAQFDVNNVQTLVGTITKMEWRSPHAWLYIDVKKDSGEVESWSLEFSSANTLYSRGWRKEDLPIGATVTVTGYGARDPKLHTLSARQVKLPDGKTLFEGAAAAAQGQ
ncbi:MAG: hypothetical protein A3F70_19115 [Acidobacteria bacterium RIFCSPLOWO2_12_FULL_67_14]|nr:MAG: hypothetical protein A3H29_12570 [Acidobacteria bacterium RIFCSPLOWO2_02_FULL_67_21]OFW36736.1 MAG: hypothetical protein A3F70_19115 [Acidobacteria bacterium RIFCSPLOWO2_12_FULL_67_14]